MNYSQIIHDKMNADIKSRYADILKQEYNIVRESQAEIIKLNPNSTKNKGTALKFVAAAFFLLIAGATLFMTVDKTLEDPKEMIHQYMAENDLTDIANTRSGATLTESITPEEKFNNAITLLQNEKYDEAVKAFENINLKSNEAFYSESKLYLIISLVLNDQNNLAKSLFNKLPDNSWEKQQLQQIMLNVE